MNPSNMLSGRNAEKRSGGVPADYGTVTPYIVSKQTAKLIDFLKSAFAAEERGRMPNEDGTIGHAVVMIGDSALQLFDARPDWPDTPSFNTLYVEDVDALHRQALAAGATELTPLADQAWGDRASRIRDPFGNIWWLQSHQEEVGMDEIARRLKQPAYAAAMKRAQDSIDREMKGRARS